MIPHNPRRMWGLGCLVLLTCCQAIGLTASESEPTFQLVESFGVTHPSQVVSFELAHPIDAKQSALFRTDGADGREVPYQILAGGSRIAFCTDLPSGATRSYTVRQGHAAQVFDGVQIDESQSGYIEISNGLTGVRVPRVYAPLTPQDLKSPVQGIRLRDGTWTPPGSPLLLGDPWYEPTPPTWRNMPTSIDQMLVTWIERGPIRTVVQVEYQFTVNPWGCPGGFKTKNHPDGKLNHPGGKAHYRLTLEIQRGEPSILAEVDTDYKSELSMSLYAGAKPTAFRYRGHLANAKATGQEANGDVYVNYNHDHDCAPQVIDYSKDTTSVPPSMPCRPGYVGRAGVAGWNPWQANGGWVEMIYRSEGEPASPAIALFAGAASRLIAGSFGQVGFYSNRTPDAGIHLVTEVSLPDDSHAYGSTVYNTIRFPFGIFVGTRADVSDDLSATHAAIQQYARHGGGLNLDKLVQWKLSFPEPTIPFGSMYMPKESVTELIRRCRTDNDFYQQLYTEDTYNRDIWDMWGDDSGGKAQAMATKVTTEIGSWIEEWANQGGYFSCKYTTQNWLLPAPKLDRIDLLLGDPQVPEAERIKLKACAAFLANWLWDYDAYPLKWEGGLGTAGVNMGSANMPGQWVGARSAFTWFLSSHPAMQPHLAESVPGLWMINENGAPQTCPHYTGTFTPQHNVIMRRARVGIDDWRTEPKLPRLAEWYLQMLTPPEVRFGGLRVLIPDGNSSACERPSMYGEMGTASFASHPALSQRLMGAWASMGSPQDGFYGSSSLRIMASLPKQDPQLGSATFPGYGAVLRHGWGTPQETSIHGFNGNFYRDHRDENSGNLHLYALGAPVLLDWESMYSPAAVGATMQNTVVPESVITAAGMTWDGEGQKTPQGHLFAPKEGWEWSTQRQDLFLDGVDGELMSFWTAGNGMEWTRRVADIHPDPDYPIIVVVDRFTGGAAAIPMVLNFNLMATGPVGTPAGAITPAAHFWKVEDPAQQQPPAVGAAQILPAGLQRFTCTGQQFGTAGVTPAVDWDLYTDVAAAGHFALGSWGHNSMGSSNERFRAANGRPYEQRQYLLRLRASGGFTTLILPRRVGAAAAQVEHTAEGYVIRMGDKTTTVREQGFTFVSPQKQVVSTYGAERGALGALACAGGPTEMIHDLAGGRITVTAHGPSGERVLSVPPGQWHSTAAGVIWDATRTAWIFAYTTGGVPGSAVAATIELTTAQPKNAP